MRLIETDKIYEYHLMDDSQLIAKGFIFENEASKFYAKPRMNYFIEFDLVEGQILDHARELVYGLIDIAKERRKKYKDHDARVYNCSFSHKKDIIDFYQSIDGFVADEGMHVLTFDHPSPHVELDLDDAFNLQNNKLETEEKINELLKYHGQSFKAGLYTKDDLELLKEQNGFKCVSVYKNDIIAANIIFFIDEEANGFLEDLFVNADYRGFGLGKYLVNHCKNDLESKGVKQINLEVWSHNKKAYNLYKKMGYYLNKVTEVSIGMSI